MANVDLKAKITDGLQDQGARTGRYRAFGIIRPGMQKMVAVYPELTNKLRATKEYSIDHIDQMVAQAVEVLENKGVKVYLADTPEQAREYIGNIVEKKLVVKSKTNAGKEIDISKYLSQQGATVIETDLGDRITQLEGKGRSTHPLAPAIHVPIEEATKLLSTDVGEQLECDENKLVKAARKSLRHYLLEAEIGITGANAIDAETGSIVVTENEGNIRAVTGMPQVHIAIAGIEKIVPKLTDCITVVKSAATYGVGQDIGTYITMISGPASYNNDELDFLGVAQGPEEIHVVFLTNGRKKAIEEGYKESLYCINCGSCVNFCPVYGEIGDKFGYKYIGGRGTVFAAFHGDLDASKNAGLSLCIGCGKCETVCAVGMKTPKMIESLRAKQVDKEGLSAPKKAVFNLIAKNKLGSALKIARNFQGLGIKKDKNGDGAQMRVGLGSMGIPGDRYIPTLAKKSLAELLKDKTPVANPKSTVALFAGCMANYIKPSLGVDVVDVLTANKVNTLTYKEEACCGLPAIMSGGSDQAKELALKNIELFSKEDFEYLIFICPSCATTVKKEWAQLISGEKDKGLIKKYQKLADKVIDLNDYLVNVLKVKVPKLKEKNKVTYHDSCHLARGLHVTQEPRKLLNDLGAKFIEMEEPDSCCGFGGSFSLFYYDLSKRINDQKINKIGKTGADYVVTSCPGCWMHINDGLHRAQSPQKVVHIVELLAKAYRGGTK